MDVKKHLSIEEQVELLKSRGCIIKDEELAKKYYWILITIDFHLIFCLSNATMINI